MTAGLSIRIRIVCPGGNAPPSLSRRHVVAPIVCLTAALLSPPDICAQDDPPTSVATVEVVPGGRYAMGSFGRFFWGDHYRDAWTTPLKVEVLDLGRFAGGLTPLRKGGGRQTKSLRFLGADGREYSFRSIDKDPASALPPLFRTTIAASVVQDQISSQHPLGALVSDPILEAAGVLHANPMLVVMPDDEVLGEYREEFAGMLGMMEVRPDDYETDIADFAGAKKVIGSETLLEDIRDSPKDRVNSRVFLNARLLDFYLGDWDRHIDQWRWAEFGGDSIPGWCPIPKDRDQVFSKLDGLFPSIAQFSMPQIVGYSDKYLSILSLHWNSRDIDRRFLSDLERSVWDSITINITTKLTDSVINEAVRRLPDTLFQLDGAWLTETLVSRRILLGGAATDFYEMLARDVEVHATDKPEVVQISEGVGGYIDVTVSERSPDATPYYRRQFDPNETKEIRIHLYGGDDSVRVRGSPELGSLVRLVGGKGDDTFAFDTPTSGVKLYDDSGENRVIGDAPRGAKINDRSYEPGDRVAIRDWGTAIIPNGYIAYGTDYGVLFKVGMSRLKFGFRKDPYATKWTLSAAIAARKRFDVSFEHDYRLENSSRHIHTRAYGTSFDVLHYYGQGNNTSDSGGTDYYEVERRLLTLEPLLGKALGEEVDVRLGPTVRYSRTGDNTGKFISTIPDLYGTGGFGHAGLGVDVLWDTRQGMSLDSVEHLSALTGVGLDLRGRVYPTLWDVRSAYGTLSAVGRAYLPAGLVPNTMLAFRVGGKKVWGEFPWFDAAFVGGEESLRGWRAQRFAGDASLYGSAELRVYLTDFTLLVPQLFGVYGLFDVGRVWVEGESPGGWHTGYGGGIWLGFLGARYLLSASFVASREGGGLYIGWGFGF